MNSTFPYHPTSDAELLIHLMGGSSTLDKINTILHDFQGIKGLAQATPLELSRHPLISETTGHRLYAAFELGHRNLLPHPPRQSITTPEQVFQLVWSELNDQSQELLIVQYLNRRRKLLQQSILTSGSDAMTIVDPKQIYQKAILCRAHAIIMVHNHPSGDPTPSQQDLLITEHVARFGEILRIPLLDHVIVGSGTFVSLKSLGVLS